MKRHFAIYGVLSLVTIASCGDAEQPEAPPQQDLRAEGYLVTPGSFDNTIVVSADLMASEQVELKAPVSGQVLEINFREGQEVRKGQSIIRLDDRSWRAQLIGLRAQLETAEKEYDRKKQLLEVEGSSQEEVDRAFTDVELLKSQIQQLTVNIDLANVTAPFSGTIGMRNFSKGAYLKEGESITFLTETGQLKVDFTVAQEYRNSIEVGKTVRVVIEKDTFDAKIYAINPLINENSRTINVRAILPQPGSRIIMPGSFAEVLIATNFADDALLVPTQAIIPEINSQTVYVYRNGKAEKKTVQIGNRTADRVHVLSGISAGDTIITSGLMQIKEGMGISLQSVTTTR